MLVYSYTIVGMLDTLNAVSLPAGVTEVPSSVAVVNSQMVSSSVQDQIKSIVVLSVVFSPLTADEQGQVRSLLTKYANVFSAHDGDLGCSNLISHDIPLIDEVPVRQCYWRIPRTH